MRRNPITALIAGLAASVLLGAVAGPAEAADKAGCHEPAWAQARLPGYEIDSCAGNVWMSMNVGTRQGNQTLDGSRETVVYKLADRSKDVPNAAARQHYAEAGQQAGATAMTDPNGGWSVVMRRQAPDGEYWYLWKHGGGNETSTTSYTVVTVKIGAAPQDVQARADGGVLPDSGVPCENPPWLVRQFADFKLAHCTARGFDRIDMEAKDGRKTVVGQIFDADYAVVEASKAPVAAFVARNYIAALQQIGATLVSDPRHANLAILVRNTPAGQIWYRFRQTQGNEESLGAYKLTTLRVAPMPREVTVSDSTVALDTKARTCKLPPWLVKQFAYFRLDHCDGRDFDTLKLALPGGEKVLAGRIVKHLFTMSEPGRTAVTFVVRDNYIDALKELGAQLVSDPKRVGQAVLTRETPQGQFWYIYAQASGNAEEIGTYTLTTVQIGGPPPKDCTLQVYGVNFDFDKAILRPDSEPVLKQVLALFTAEPTYAAEVGGHTDNVGKPPYNMKLSRERAEAVKAWLVAHGIAANRIGSAGYGDTRPLVPNTTDENRSRNRRVELKRNNCKG